MEEQEPLSQHSQLQIKVARELRFFLNKIISKASFADPLLADTQNISFSHVDMSPDLKNALVNCSFLRTKNDDIDTKAIIKALNKAQGYFKKELSRNKNLRYIPRMKFAEDKIYDRNDKFETLMQKLHSKD